MARIAQLIRQANIVTHIIPGIQHCSILSELFDMVMIRKLPIPIRLALFWFDVGNRLSH